MWSPGSFVLESRVGEGGEGRGGIGSETVENTWKRLAWELAGDDP